MMAAYNDTPPDVRNRIRDERKAQKLTLEELAALTGISWQTLQRYETGVRAVTLDKLELIAKALNVPSSKLVKDAIELTDEERDVVEWMRRFPRDRQLILSQVRALRETREDPDEGR